MSLVSDVTSPIEKDDADAPLIDCAGGNDGEGEPPPENVVDAIFEIFEAPEIPTATAFAPFKIEPNGSGINEAVDNALMTPCNVDIVAIEI